MPASRARDGTAAIAIPIVALAIALGFAAILLALSGHDPWQSAITIGLGAWGSAKAVNATLALAAPLLLTGVAANIAFRARLFNFGGEGQLVAGAIVAATWGASAIAALPWLAIPVALATGALAGGALMMIATTLRIRHGVSEFITTLLINVIMAVLVVIPMPGTPTPMAPIWATAQAAFAPAGLALGGGLSVPLGLALGLVAALALFLMLRRTLWGFDIRAVGGSPTAAQFAGIPFAATLLRVALLSGALAGLAGAVVVTGLAGSWVPATMHGLGYAGIAIAVLAGRSPLAAIVYAVVAASLITGTAELSRALATPASIAEIVLAAALLLTLIGRRFTTRRWSALRSAEVAA